MSEQWICAGHAGALSEDTPIEFKRTDPQMRFERRSRHLTATQQNFETRGHFLGGERLGQIIVAASAQPAHPFVHITQRA